MEGAGWMGYDASELQLRAHGYGIHKARAMCVRGAEYDKKQNFLFQLAIHINWRVWG